MAKKNKTKKTYFVIVMDRSSSMSSTKEQAVEAYNSQVRAAREADQDDKNHEVFVGLITFATDVREHLWLQRADKLEEANWETYQPSGCTAMFDGMGYAIDKLTAEVQLGEDDAVLFVTISDGEENSSSHVSGNQLASKIKELDAQDNWTFTFMGCSVASIKEVACATGIGVANMAAWDNTNMRGAVVGSYQNAVKVKDYFGDRKRGVKKLATFHSLNDSAPADYADENLMKASYSTAQSHMAAAANNIKCDVFNQGNTADWGQYQARNQE